MLTLPLCIPYINQNQVQRINSVVSIFSSAGGKSLHLTTVHCPCKDMWSLRGKEFFFSSRWDWSPHLPYLTATLPVQPSNQLGLNPFKLEFFQVVLKKFLNFELLSFTNSVDIIFELTTAYTTSRVECETC